MYEKESKNIKYHNDSYRAVNFRVDQNGDLICPNNRKFHYAYSRPIKGNNMGERGNCIVRINEELTTFHKEVLNNLNCIHRALLRMNRSIQSEGTNGIIKWNRLYEEDRNRKSSLKKYFNIC